MSAINLVAQRQRKNLPENEKTSGFFDAQTARSRK